MWAQLKMNHATDSRSRREVIIIVVALALIAVMLSTFTTLARDQVHKAELRDALLQTQRSAMARCWREARNPVVMRSCAAEVALRTGVAPDPSADLAASTAATSHVSMVSLKY